MQYTDIVKARALRRAGRACEMCGAYVGFESAEFVSAHPIFGILFDQDDCCVLCADCLAELDSETRAAAERGPCDALTTHEACADPADLTRDPAAGTLEAVEDDVEPERSDALRPISLPPDAREARFPRRDPDGGMCA